MIHFEQQTIQVATKYGPFDVDALAVGTFAVHPHIESANGRLYLGNGWEISHIPTGRAANQVEIDNRETAIAVALMLNGSGIDFGTEQPAPITREEKRLANWIAHTSTVFAPTFDMAQFVTTSTEGQANS